MKFIAYFFLKYKIHLNRILKSYVFDKKTNKQTKQIKKRYYGSTSDPINFRKPFWLKKKTLIKHYLLTWFFKLHGFLIKSFFRPME